MFTVLCLLLFVYSVMSPNLLKKRQTYLNVIVCHYKNKHHIYIGENKNLN